jgi:hypothetical protein
MDHQTAKDIEKVFEIEFNHGRRWYMFIGYITGLFYLGNISVIEHCKFYELGRTLENNGFIINRWDL